MNWQNIDLNSSYETSQEVLNSYDIDTLLLEIDCNFKKEDITKEKVIQHIKDTIQSRVNCALEVFENNLENIVKKAIEDK